MDNFSSPSSIPATVNLFVCLESQPIDTAANLSRVKSYYFGIIVERSETDGHGAYLRVGSFYTWSKEENENDYLRNCITEIDIY
jgi:hypothetical protein